MQECDRSRDEAQSIVQEALNRANDVEKRVAEMEATLLEANRNTREAVKLQQASEIECNDLRAQVSELVW
jgi:hypothetical protein